MRETEDRARGTERGESEPSTPRGVVHPDLSDVLGAAEDALSAALGLEVRARERKGRCVVELSFATPSEAIRFAEQRLRRAA